MKELTKQYFELRLQLLTFEDVGGWVEFEEATQVADISAAVVRANNKLEEAKYAKYKAPPEKKTTKTPARTPKAKPKPLPKKKVTEQKRANNSKKPSPLEPKLVQKFKPAPRAKSAIKFNQEKKTSLLERLRTQPGLQKSTLKSNFGTRHRSSSTSSYDSAVERQLRGQTNRSVRFSNNESFGHEFWSVSEPPPDPKPNRPKKPPTDVPLVKDVLTDLIPPDVDQFGLCMDRLLLDTPEKDGDTSDSVSCYSSDCSFATCNNDPDDPNCGNKISATGTNAPITARPGLKLDLSQLGPPPREVIASLPIIPIYKCEKCGFVTSNSTHIKLHSCLASRAN